MNPIYTQLKKYGRVKVDEPLAKHTTFKIGGTAQFLVIIDTIDQLVAALDYVRGDGIPYRILGGGSNTLASDEVFEGVVLKIAAKQKEVTGTVVTAEAGCSTVEIAQYAMQHGLTGFEWGVGVPGTIGGAVRGNAGAMGGEMKDSVLSVEAYHDGEVVTYSRSECVFSYRGSLFKETDDVVLRVQLQLAPATDGAGGMKQALEHLQYRNKTQPQGWASTGCIFINPDFKENKKQLEAQFDMADEKVISFQQVGKISAGWLIDQAGLKGMQIGQAQVSEQHGNFIVNLGNATATDVTQLIEKIQEEVYSRYSIHLEEEIAIY